MAFNRPGVYVQETLTPTIPTAGPNSNSVAAFVGANDRGPTLPTLVTSWTQYANLFGTWNTVASNDLPIAVYLFFTNGGRQAYIQRVVTTGDVNPSNNATAATRTLTDRAGSPLNTLKLTAANPGTWGNNLNVSIINSALTGYFNLIVNYNGTTNATIVEQFTDLSMNSTDPRYAVSVINSSSAYLVAADQSSATASPNNNPSVVTNVALASGQNGIAITSTIINTVMSQLDPITQSLMINVAGYTDATTVNNALNYAGNRGDCFVVVDGIDDTAANQITTAAGYTSPNGSYGAVYFPRLIISDPTVGLGASRGATRTAAPGGAILGIIASTDAARGVFKAPAGLSARVAGAVSIPKLTPTELDNLNTASVPVNAIKYVPGSGIVVMGSRTLNPSYATKYVPVRRTLIYLEKSLQDLSQIALFEPNDAVLWRRLTSTLSSFLTSFWSNGGLVGSTPASAFYVKVDSTNNTPASIDNGEVHIEVGVALQRPAEFVIIKIGQFNGTTTVTIA